MTTPTITPETIRNEVLESVKRLIAKGEASVRFDDIVGDLIASGIEPSARQIDGVLRHHVKAGNLHYQTKAKAERLAKDAGQSGLVKWGWLLGRSDRLTDERAERVAKNGEKPARPTKASK